MAAVPSPEPQLTCDDLLHQALAANLSGALPVPVLAQRPSAPSRSWP